MSKPVPQSTIRTGILAQRYASQAQRYFSRHGYAQPPALPAPDPELGIVVVIPARAEPDVVSTLDSVADAQRPRCPVELMLVVNAGADATPEARKLNRQTIAIARDWAAPGRDRPIRCHVLDCRDLPPEHATVGLARKIGFDAGLSRLAATRAGRGILVSLDADCRVAANYLTSIDDHFRLAPDSIGATVYFEHPLGNADTPLRQAIVDYELHLRCYRHGLRAAGSPYAVYTLGSAFAVRSEIYARQGGMNRRAAGEDFYFINKLLRHAELSEITGTAVFPAARISDRVPFGTGAALRRSAEQPITTYAAGVYRELGSFLTAVQDHVLAGRQYPQAYAGFLDTMGFDSWLQKTRANVASAEALSGHLRQWLDGFRIMKFVNRITRDFHPRVPPADAARDILSRQGIGAAGGAEALLERFRDLDRR